MKKIVNVDFFTIINYIIGLISNVCILFFLYSFYKNGIEISFFFLMALLADFYFIFFYYINDISLSDLFND